MVSGVHNRADSVAQQVARSCASADGSSVAATWRPACGKCAPPSCTTCRFSDYVQSPSGLQYYDIREGTGPTPQQGQTCVVDWAGVTIGYYGAWGLGACVAGHGLPLGCCG